MLFEASPVYAPGEPHGAVAASQYQNMGIVARYHLNKLGLTNVWVGMAGLALLAYMVHSHGGRK